MEPSSAYPFESPQVDQTEETRRFVWRVAALDEKNRRPVGSVLTGRMVWERRQAPDRYSPARCRVSLSSPSS